MHPVAVTHERHPFVELLERPVAPHLRHHQFVAEVPRPVFEQHLELFLIERLVEIPGNRKLQLPHHRSPRKRPRKTGDRTTKRQTML